MELSPMDRVLVSLSTLGPDHHYLHPGKIAPVGPGEEEGAAMTLDLEALDCAVVQGLACNPGGDHRRFALTDRGQERVWMAVWRQRGDRREEHGGARGPAVKTCVNCGGEAGIDTVETKDGTAHYSAHDCVRHLKAENAGLRTVVTFLQESVCRRNCFPEENAHVGDCEKASEMMRGVVGAR